MTTDTDYVLIVEPNFTGHRWRYAEWTADAYAEAGYRCVIVTECCNEDHRLARKIADANRTDLEIAFVDPAPRRSAVSLAKISYARHHQYFHRAYELLRNVYPIAFVVVPYVDYFLYALPFLGTPFGRTPWLGITMRTSFHHRRVGVKAPERRLVNAVKERLFVRAARTHGLKALLSIDPTLQEWAAHAVPKGGAAIQYLADPFPDVKPAPPAVSRARLGLARDGRYLLVYGSITERKGIRELVDALAGRDDAPTLVIAGEQDDETRVWLHERSRHLAPPPLVLDAFITNDVERDLFSACDAVWLGYRGHYGMSGVLVQAYRFNKPVIATSDGLIGWFCRGGELGPTLDDLSPESIRRALGEVLAAPPADAAGEPSPEHLLARNTLARFKETLQQAARLPETKRVRDTLLAHAPKRHRA
jgi:glycosyltransferase involved in cell wall biosynthesis